LQLFKGPAVAKLSQFCS